MCTFDSPVSRCELIHEMVLTDVTNSECAAEHNCPEGCACPLAGYFAEFSGITACYEWLESKTIPLRTVSAPKVAAEPKPFSVTPLRTRMTSKVMTNKDEFFLRPAANNHRITDQKIAKAA